MIKIKFKKCCNDCVQLNHYVNSDGIYAAGGKRIRGNSR